MLDALSAKDSALFLQCFLIKFLVFDTLLKHSKLISNRQVLVHEVELVGTSFFFASSQELNYIVHRNAEVFVKVKLAVSSFDKVVSYP